MAQEPVIMMFGDSVATLNEDGWFYCHGKNVRVQKSALVESIRKLNTHPLRTKFLVGFTIKTVPNPQGLIGSDDPNEVYLWREEDRTHIGCLYEKTRDFNRKYLELITKTTKQ